VVKPPALQRRIIFAPGVNLERIWAGALASANAKG
jgi:hypothetical protein